MHQIHIFKRTFFYMIINTIVIPGFATNIGCTVFDIIRDNYNKDILSLVRKLGVRNNEGFYLVYLLESVSFYFLFGLILYPHLYRHFLSPKTFIRSTIREKPKQEFFKREDLLFNYGVNYAGSCVDLAIMFLYS